MAGGAAVLLCCSVVCVAAAAGAAGAAAVAADGAVRNCQRRILWECASEWWVASSLFFR
jgi:hypothetical protein